MRLRGEFVDIICDLNLQYLNCVAYKKGKKVLYLYVIRSIYICLEASILWCDLYNTLEDVDFKLNSYDRCVSNKEIHGKQCTGF